MVDQPPSTPNAPAYDLIIIGAGPAGLCASLYASRYKVNHLIIGENPGGQGLLAGTVENYPGFEKISGVELMQKMINQTEGYGVKIIRDQVKKLAKVGDLFKVHVDGQTYLAKTLILAMGATLRHLGIPGEDEFVGKGVSHCTTCDAPFFKDKVVAVVGGGNAAVNGAIHLSAFAKKIYLIHRRQEYRAEPYRVEMMGRIPQIEQVLSNGLAEIIDAADPRLGGQNPQPTGRVGGVVLNTPYNGQTVLPLDGVFIEIGHVPSTSLVGEIGVEKDGQDHVVVNPDMTTNIPSVFGCGDLVAIKGGILLHQYVTAVATGAIAAASVYRRFRDEKAQTS